MCYIYIYILPEAFIAGHMILYFSAVGVKKELNETSTRRTKINETSTKPHYLIPTEGSFYGILHRFGSFLKHFVCQRSARRARTILSEPPNLYMQRSLSVDLSGL